MEDNYREGYCVEGADWAAAPPTRRPLCGCLASTGHGGAMPNYTRQIKSNSNSANTPQNTPTDKVHISSPWAMHCSS